MSESIDHSWTCREDFGIERNESFKENQGNAQFSLCCTSTAMPDDESQDRHPAFCCTNQEQNRYFSIRETCPATSCHRPSRLISVSVNCTMRSKGFPSVVPFTLVFPTTATLSP